MDPTDRDAATFVRALGFALEKYPNRVTVLPLPSITLDSARQNDKRPAFVKLAVPDEVVQSLRSAPDKRRQVTAVVSLPADVAERLDSTIILPGE